MSRERRGEADLPPGPARDLIDLYRRLRYARKLSGGQLAIKTGHSAGYISEVMRGWKSPSPDVAAEIAVALGASIDEVRLASKLAEESAHLNRYNRVKMGLAARDAAAKARSPRPLDSSVIRQYQVTGITVPPHRHIGTVSGDIRRVRCADVWVNPENTEMQMARFNEFSVSSIIRYEGARRDELGRVTDDCIAAELTRKVAGRAPVPPATAIITGSGELKQFGVSHIVHVAAVYGEPGEGFRQVRQVGSCLTNVMTEVDRITDWPYPQTILFPLLGAGQGGGQIDDTVSALTGAAIDYFGSVYLTRITTVFLLAYTDTELGTCEKLLSVNKRLVLRKD